MDTIIIKLYGKFKTGDRSLFVPELTKRDYKDLSPTERTSKHQYLRRFKLEAKQQEEYLPRVEIFEALNEDRTSLLYVMKIEFSAPKLLYWNSLQEVGEDHKERVFSALKSALALVSIFVETDTIADALVSAVHICKNIPLPKTIKMREIINELSKVDISKAFDVADKQDKKGARVLNIYAGTTDWSFYDKIADAERPKNKRSDKHRINHERTIIELYNLHGREVFRYEYRIKKNQTVRREVNALLGRDYTSRVVFKDLFTPNLLKKLTLNSWHKITERPENQLSLFSKVDKLTLLLHILSEAEKRGVGAHSMNNALISYGIATVIQDHGAKELKAIMFESWCKGHPERLTKKIKLASEFAKGLPVSSKIAFLNTALEKFEIISLASLEKGI